MLLFEMVLSKLDNVGGQYYVAKNMFEVLALYHFANGV